MAETIRHALGHLHIDIGELTEHAGADCFGFNYRQ